MGKWLKNWQCCVFGNFPAFHRLVTHFLFTLLSQDHRAQWWPVSTHLQALPDPHQQDGGSGDSRRGHHSRSHGLLHHSCFWWSWWEIWGSFPGGAWWVYDVVIHLSFVLGMEEPIHSLKLWIPISELWAKDDNQVFTNLWMNLEHRTVN